MLRNLYKSDLNRILEIEKSVHIAPWTEETFKLCFEAGYLGWVLEINQKIVGFIIISMTLDECHILNVCVLHEFQHKGYGHMLMEAALRHAKKNNVAIAYLEVRKSNLRAISLYRKMAFKMVGQRKEYYPTEGGKEDALIFALSLHDLA